MNASAADVPCEDAQTFVDVIQRLYGEKFTGEMLVRWAQGHPRVVEFPGAPQRIVLDTDRRRRA